MLRHRRREAIPIHSLTVWVFSTTASWRSINGTWAWIWRVPCLQYSLSRCWVLKEAGCLVFLGKVTTTNQKAKREDTYSKGKTRTVKGRWPNRRVNLQFLFPCESSCRKHHCHTTVWQWPRSTARKRKLWLYRRAILHNPSQNCTKQSKNPQHTPTSHSKGKAISSTAVGSVTAGLGCCFQKHFKTEQLLLPRQDLLIFWHSRASRPLQEHKHWQDGALRSNSGAFILSSSLRVIGCPKSP